MQIGVITNPNSRKNKDRPDRAARLQSIVGDLGEVHETDSVDSIKPVLRDFLRKRARYWVADGGDGAMHWMMRMGMEVLQEDEFESTRAKITLDGMILPGEEFTGIHVASMSINLGGVLRFFGQADQRGLMNAIIGSPSPLGIAMNLPRMVRGAEMRGRNVLDR